RRGAAVGATLPTLNRTAAASVSTITTPAASLLPGLVNVSVYVRSVPGRCVLFGLTALDEVRLGRITVTPRRACPESAALPTVRAVRKRVSLMPAATLTTRYVPAIGAAAPTARPALRALPVFAPR